MLDIFITADGSPTLVFKRADGYGEKMHHSHGALSESVYIYQEALHEVLRRDWPARVLSVGLGLGYNEMLAVAALPDSREWKIWSFELLPELRDGFRDWLESGSQPENPLHETFDQVLALVAAQSQMSAAALRERLAIALRSEQLELRGSFPDELAGVTEVTCVFYDAYSKKMDPHLWQEDSLCSTLAPCLAKQVLFSTYAATGSLNRALKGLGFELLRRPGFSGKRESTWAFANFPKWENPRSGEI